MVNVTTKLTASKGGIDMEKESKSLLNSLEADLVWALANLKLLDTGDVSFMLLKVKHLRLLLKEGE